MSSRARGFGVTLLGAALLAPVQAHAELPLDLTWHAPAGCPSASAVRTELQRVVRVRAGGAAPLLVVEARIEERGGRWQLQLRTRRDGVSGERQLEGASCAALVGAATLVMALSYGEGVEVVEDALSAGGNNDRAGTPPGGGPQAVAPPSSSGAPQAGSPGTRGTTRAAPPATSARNNPTATPGRVPAPQVARPDVDLRPPVMFRAPPAPPPEPEAPEPTMAPTSDPDEPAADPAVAAVARAARTPSAPGSAPDRPLAWSLFANARSGWGPLPKQAFGFGAGLEVGSERWFASLRVNASPTVETSQDPGLRLRFASAGGSLSGCVRGALTAAVAATGCGGLQITGLRGESIGTTGSQAVLAPLTAALATVRLEAPLSRALSVQLGAELATSLQRPRFEITGIGDVFQVPRLAPSAVLGLAIRL